MIFDQIVSRRMSLQMPVFFRHARSPFAMLFFMGGEGFALYTATGWLYYALMESSPLQGTLGKAAVGLRVTDQRGNRISFARASARFFSKLLSAITFDVGFVIAALTPKKQALHDLIASCLVIKRL